MKLGKKFINYTRVIEATATVQPFASEVDTNAIFPFRKCASRLLQTILSIIIFVYG